MATKTKSRITANGTNGDVLDISGSEPKVTGKHVSIPAPNFITGEFTIRGFTPYVQHAFSQKSFEMMKEAQEAGSTSRKGKKKEAKNFQECYEQSKHVSTEGWYGIPAPAFRKACISACRLVGFKMTLAKLSVFTLADGYDKNDGTPLVRITKGEPHYHEMAVILTNGSRDIHARAMWDQGWEAVVRIRYDADQFTAEDIANLMMRAGMQVGIGEGRPDSKNSDGCGWGQFEVVSPKGK